MKTIKIPEEILRDVQVWHDRTRNIMGEMKRLECERSMFVSKIWMRIFSACPEVSASEVSTYDMGAKEITFGTQEEVLKDGQE